MCVPFVLLGEMQGSRGVSHTFTTEDTERGREVDQVLASKELGLGSISKPACLNLHKLGLVPVPGLWGSRAADRDLLLEAGL